MKSSDLFESARKEEKGAEPLASRMRPRTLDEYVGQDHIVGKPVVIWLSTDRNEKFPKNIRWNRFLKFL